MDCDSCLHIADLLQHGAQTSPGKIAKCCQYGISSRILDVPVLLCGTKR